MANDPSESAEAETRAGSWPWLLLLALLPFVLFWPVTLGRMVFAEGDLFFFNYPLLHTIARQWKAGEVPLWNPYIFGGTPLLAQMQGGVFYPPNAIFLLLPEWLAFQLSILLHYALAGVFMFLYSRTLRLTRDASVIAALVFMLGGFTIAHLGHVSTLRTVPWLPLILCGLESWRRGGGAGSLALGAGAAGCMLLAGHPQIPFYSLITAAAYVTYRAATEPPRRSRLAGGFLFVLMGGCGLAAVQIAPTLAALPEYLRPSEGSYAYFTHGSLHPLQLVTLAFPAIVDMDRAELSGYVGIATLLLAALGALMPAREHDAPRGFLVGVAVVSVLLAFGDHLPFYSLLFRVPIYNLFTVPARHWFEFTFAVAALAGAGVDGLRDPQEPERARKFRRALVAVFAGMALAGAAAVATAQHLSLRLPEVIADLSFVSLRDPEVWQRLPFLVLAPGLLFFLPARLRGRSGAWTWALVVLIVADLFSFGGSIYKLYPASVVREPPSSLRALARAAQPFRVLTLGEPEEMDLPLAKDLLLRDANALWGVESVNGFDSLMLRRVDEASGHGMPTYGGVRGPAVYNAPQFRRFMDLLGARYVLSPSGGGGDLDPGRYRRVFRDASVDVFENVAALPRFFAVPTALRVSAAEALASLGSGVVAGRAFDPRGLALVEMADQEALQPCQQALLRAPPATPNPSADVALLPSGAADVRLRVRSAQAGLLLHGTNHADGWTAWVDGERAPLHRVDGFVQGACVPAGDHEVSFRYEPRSFRIGAAISLGSLLALAAWPVWLRRMTETSANEAAVESSPAKPG